MGRHLVFFSEDRIALEKEMKEHPELAEGLKHYKPDEFVERLGVAAAFLGLEMDGYFNAAELDRLSGLICRGLQKKRMIVVRGPIEIH